MSERDPQALDELGRRAARLYIVFARYRDPGSHFCGLCYTPDDVSRLTSTSIRALDEEDVRRLLWETANHWQDADVYRHYLPRLLEAMGPPLWVENSNSKHLAETLVELGFAGWPAHQREAVIAYLEALECCLEFFFADEIEEWHSGMNHLRNASRQAS